GGGCSPRPSPRLRERGRGEGRRTRPHPSPLLQAGEGASCLKRRAHCVAHDAKRFSSSSPWSAQNLMLNCSASFALAGAVGRLASVSESSLDSASLFVGPYAMFFAYSACACGVLANWMNL